jgi:ATP-binding cassette subfamily F protein 3
MQKLQKQIQAFANQLEDPALYEKEPQKAIRINKDMSDAKSALASAEEKWLELSSEYEEAMAD